VTGLEPKSMYQLALAESPNAPYGKLQPLSDFMTDATGAKIVTTIGPLRRVIVDDKTPSRRYLVIVPVRDGVPGLPVQVQL